MLHQPKISIVIPIYNEAKSLVAFHESLLAIINADKNYGYELIYCDDGSSDNSAQIVQKWRTVQKNVILLRLSRNFGKENALTAGIASATGDAIITIDGDGQHPVELIPEFIKVWKTGAQVVIGIRTNDANNDLFKKIGSRLFYSFFNLFTKQKLIPGSTDYRLITKQVRTAFLQLPETDRLTRGLIDWLGFNRQYIKFNAKRRQTGNANYSRGKLISLASNSLVSMTPVPLYIFGWIGVIITIISLSLGLAVFIEQLVLNDPLGWNFTGTAQLSILLLFLVGMLLMAQGLLSMYVSHIYSQSKRRPLYVIDYETSAGITEPVNDQK